MPKPVIGIPGYKVDTNFGVGIANLEFVSTFGNPRIILPWEEDVPIDVLYLTGGLDVNPTSYGEVPGFKTSNTDVFKQFFFEKRLCLRKNFWTCILCFFQQKNRLIF